MEREKRIELLSRMIRVRSFEKRVAILKAENAIAGPVHTCIGEEAIDVGICAALSSQDYIVGNFRSHGHLIAKGAAMNPLMAEIFGKSTGLNGGRGGSMHVADSSVGSLGASAIVASGIPTACGAAFASLLRKEDRVACVFFGDGATNEGVFHECLNLASAWNLPVLFVLENNGYAITTPLGSVSVDTDIYRRAEPFRIASAQIDGQNVELVESTAAGALREMRRGSGPFFLEAKTSLFRPHQEGAHHERLARSGFRDEDELCNWISNRDPIQLYTAVLLADKVISESEVEKIWKDATGEVEDAVKFAMDSPLPEIDHACKKVFV